MEYCNHCGKEVETQGFRPKKFCNDDCRYAFHNKKKKKWTLKKLAKHYQETGEYLPEAQEAEEIHLMSIAEEIEHCWQSYIESPKFFTDEFPMTLDNLISISIGHW